MYPAPSPTNPRQTSSQGQPALFLSQQRGNMQGLAVTPVSAPQGAPLPRPSAAQSPIATEELSPRDYMVSLLREAANAGNRQLAVEIMQDIADLDADCGNYQNALEGYRRLLAVHETTRAPAALIHSLKDKLSTFSRAAKSQGVTYENQSDVAPPKTTYEEASFRQETQGRGHIPKINFPIDYIRKRVGFGADSINELYREILEKGTEFDIVNIYEAVADSYATNLSSEFQEKAAGNYYEAFQKCTEYFQKNSTDEQFVTSTLKRIIEKNNQALRMVDRSKIQGAVTASIVPR